MPRRQQEAFFRIIFDKGVWILQSRLERIVVGNAVIEHSVIVLEKDELEPSPLAQVVHDDFDDKARIKKMRLSFDMKSISRQLAPNAQGCW